MRLIMIVIVIFALLRVPANAQQRWDELFDVQPSTGLCKYGPYPNFAGEIGCVIGGNCLGPVGITVGIIQTWSCSTVNIVSGGAYVLYKYDLSGATYQYGLLAFAEATPANITYSTHEEDGCDGYYDYGGDFTYTC